jgi:hypothetical protein
MANPNVILDNALLFNILSAGGGFAPKVLRWLEEDDFILSGS